MPKTPGVRSKSNGVACGEYKDRGVKIQKKTKEDPQNITLFNVGQGDIAYCGATVTSEPRLCSSLSREVMSLVYAQNNNSTGKFDLLSI